MHKEINPALANFEGRVGRIAEIIDEMKGENMVFMDLREICDFTDGFIIATTRSATQMQAIAGRLLEQLKAEGLTPVNKPDMVSTRWTLLDYSNVIVHLFDAESRLFYDLERLWGDAPAVPVADLGLRIAE